MTTCCLQISRSQDMVPRPGLRSRSDLGHQRHPIPVHIAPPSRSPHRTALSTFQLEFHPACRRIRALEVPTFLRGTRLRPRRHRNERTRYLSSEGFSVATTAYSILKRGVAQTQRRY